MYDELVKRLRYRADREDDYYKHGGDIINEAADAIEEMSRQRDRAYARLCEWCGVCPEEKRNPEDCEIAALNPEPPEGVP